MKTFAHKRMLVGEPTLLRGNGVDAMSRSTARRGAPHAVLVALALALHPACAASQHADATATNPETRDGEQPPGFWPLERARAVLDRTRTVVLSPDLSRLSDGEQRCVQKLLQTGAIMQALYEHSLHPDAPQARASLARLGDGPQAEALRDLYRLFQGPVARVDGDQIPFLPVGPRPVGGGVYPVDAEHDELARFIDDHPRARDALLHPRTVVRRATAAAIDGDLDALARHPRLAAHHDKLRERLQRLQKEPDPRAFYAVPYAVAYADDLGRAHDLLVEAAVAVQGDDPAFAEYLKLRAEALLTNDYAASDAAWITGRFARLNAQIGSYEVYDDDLFGVKTFFGLSILVEDEEATKAVGAAAAQLDALQQELPWSPPRSLQASMPLAVYDVVADFGQARGTNTATILPNEPAITDAYGRRIMIRGNIVRNEDIRKNRVATWRAAVAGRFDEDLTADGELQRTVWHEVGHYLGVAVDRRGRTLDAALGAHSSVLEEMKADLVSLHLASSAPEHTGHSPQLRRQVQAAGIRRTLRPRRPHPTQAYATMQLMQLNYFLEHGLVGLDDDGQLVVDYDRYPQVVADLLERVLRLQHDGDPEAAAAFIERYTSWDDAVHGTIAARMRAALVFDYILVRYDALDG